MLLLLAACGLLTRPTPTVPTTDMAPLSIDWETGAADMFVSIVRQPPDGAAEALIWWHGPDGEKPAGATDRLGPPVGVATLLREEWAVWNVLEIDREELRPGGGKRPMTLMAGRVPDKDKRGELISDLYDHLLTRIEGNKDFESRTGVDLPDWRVGIRVAPDVPWATTQEVLFTAGQAQFSQGLCFVGSGTYEALQQRCVELPFVLRPGQEREPHVKVLVRPGTAWRVKDGGNEQLDDSGAAFSDAPEVVILHVEDADIPTGEVAKWIGIIGRSGVKRTLVDLSR